MNITSVGNQLIVSDGSYTSTTYKSLVTKVEAYLSKYIRVFVMTGYKERQWAKLDYAQIDSPATSDLDSLVELVKGYLKEPLVFVAGSGQTTFDCTGYLKLNDSFYAVLNGVRQSWNVSRSGDIAIVGNASEGDEVIIVQP